MAGRSEDMSPSIVMGAWMTRTDTRAVPPDGSRAVLVKSMGAMSSRDWLLGDVETPVDAVDGVGARAGATISTKSLPHSGQRRQPSSLY